MSRILHMSFSDSGGAGKFAQRLSDAQTRVGLDSQLISFNHGGLAKSKFQNPLITLAAMADHKVVRADSSNPMFTLFRQSIELLHRFDSLNPETIVHLHWTPGVISHNSIADLLRRNKVVWTVHDMFPITGGCHHSLECKRFENTCSACPQVRRPFQGNVEAHHQALVYLSPAFERLTVVSPSRWLEKRIKSSAIMSEAKTLHIPNPVDSNIFYIKSGQRKSRLLNKDHEFTFGICASDLSNPNKNIDQAISTLNEVARSLQPRTFRIIAIGDNLKNYKVETNITLRHYGTIESDSQLANLYREMDVFINSSLQENYSTTVLEALAVGTPCVAWNSLGTDEIIRHNKSGLIVSSNKELVDAVTILTDTESLMEFIDEVELQRDTIIDMNACVGLYNEAYEN